MPFRGLDALAPPLEDDPEMTSTSMTSGARPASPVDNVDPRGLPRDFAFFGHGLQTMPNAWLHDSSNELSTFLRLSTPGASGEYRLPISRERIAEGLLTPWPEETRPSLYGDLSFGFSSTSTTTTKLHKSNFEFKGYGCDNKDGFSDIFKRSLSFGASTRPATPPAMAAPPSDEAHVKTTPKEPYKDWLRKKLSVNYFPSTRLCSATSRSSLRSPRKTLKALPIKTNPTKEARTTSH